MVFVLFSTNRIIKPYMKLRLFYIFTLFFALTINAQIDSENKSIAIPAEEVEDPKEDNELIIRPKPKAEAIPEDTENEVVLPKTEEQPVVKRPNFSIVKENKFRNPAELYEKKLQRSLKFRQQNEKRNNGSKTTQYLGEFKTKSKRVNIIYRDHQYPDGDLIRVYVNGKVAQPRVLLETGFKGFFLKLEEGDNIIDFQALNQGSSGPNTAEFQVLNDKGFSISTNQWNLATGVKATITVIKQKEDN
jgi:hypothetical protein